MERRLIMFTNRSKSAIKCAAAMMVLCICLALAAGSNQLLGDFPLKCVMQGKGASITAIAAYDNGREAICGDSDGNIYRANSKSCEKIAKFGLASIDSIVIGDSTVGNFCFLSKGKIYSFNKNSVRDISGNLKENVAKLFKDSNNQIYAIIKNNNLYYLSDEASSCWKKAPSQTTANILRSCSSVSEANNCKNLRYEPGQNITKDS